MINVNKKKPLRLKNRTKYFNPETSKTHVTFGSPDSYQSRRIKIEGYETRLYWQYRYCDEHNGQTFFYTLTYNDKALPHHYKYACFDYEDLRDLLTGGFRKMLLRKYGTTFKYFIGAELGDGKGERGMHNNPHYHVLFFLESANNPRFPYVKISPEDFRHLVRLYWQGFDEDEDKKQGIFHEYTEAKYGIAREGENTGLVTDFRACMYCAKYVCKDAKLKMHEGKIANMCRFLTKKRYVRSHFSYEHFFNNYIRPEFNVALNPDRTEWVYTDEELIERLLPGFFNIGELRFDFFPEADISSAALQVIHKYNLWEPYHKMCRDYVDDVVHKEIVTYRNRYCNKCRISQGVGDYALSHIDDLMNPVIKVPSKKGFKPRPISMYYYRKLFTEVHVDKVGSPIRVLNELGRAYKLSRLPQQIEKKKAQAQSNLDILLSTPSVYAKMRESDVNVNVFATFDDFLRRWNYLLDENNNNIDEILQRYAEYKLIYEDRFLNIHTHGHGDVCDFPPIDCYSDYNRFLIPSYFNTRRSDLRLDTFLENDSPYWLAYSEHPYFLRYIGVFHVLDMCSDYFFVQGDDRSQEQAEEVAATKRFHTQQRVKDFYAQFGIFSN